MKTAGQSRTGCSQVSYGYLYGCKISKLDTPSSRNLPQYQIEGELTLHGTKRPVKFTVDVEDVKGWHRIRGAFAI